MPNNAKSILKLNINLIDLVSKKIKNYYQHS